MRVRIRFAKLGKIRFTSQRDVARLWERALRRARLPLAYTEGFSPRPQLSFGLALPTGCESRAEYLDVALDGRRAEAEGIDADAFPERLATALPPGIDIMAVAPVQKSSGSLQQVVTSCEWAMSFSDVSQAGLEARVATLLASPSVLITRERKGRQDQDDLRPSVLALRVTGTDRAAATGDSAVQLVAELATQPRGVRPIELVRGLAAMTAATEEPTAGPPVLVRACRTQQWIERDGIREEPLAAGGITAGAARAPHAFERAS
jgi:radical SAM-linked protein